MSTKDRRVGMIWAELGDRGKLIEPRVGHGNFADVGLDGAEGIVRGFRGRGLGQGVEEGRFADVWQADDAAFESHEFLSIVSVVAGAPGHPTFEVFGKRALALGLAFAGRVATRRARGLCGASFDVFGWC